MIRSETVSVQTLNRSNSETVSWRWNQICIDSFSDSDRLRIEQLRLQRPCSNPKSFSSHLLLNAAVLNWNFSEGRTHWSMMQSNTNVRRSEALLNEQQWQQIERLLEYWAVNHVTAVNPAALHWRNISTRSSWGTRSLEQLRHVLLCRRSALRLPSVLCWDSGRCCGCTSYSTSAMDSCKKWHKTFIKKKKQRLYYMKAETIYFIITPKMHLLHLQYTLFNPL